MIIYFLILEAILILFVIIIILLMYSIYLNSKYINKFIKYQKLKRKKLKNCLINVSKKAINTDKELSIIKNQMMLDSINDYDTNCFDKFEDNFFDTYNLF